MGIFLKNKRWIFYSLYCIALTGGLLYFLFPDNLLRDYLQVRANNLDPPLTLYVQRIKPWYPFGLRFWNTVISFKDRPKTEIFNADSIFIGPDVLSLLKGEGKYNFNSQAYGGMIKGYAYKKDSRSGDRINVKIELESINIGTHEHLKSLLRRNVDGVLYGTVHYRGVQKDLMDGSGNANLKLLDGSIEISSPVFKLESVAFNEIKIGMDIKKRKINLRQFKLTGPSLTSTVSGTIGLKKEFAKSTINLRGKVELFSAFFQDNKDTYEIMEFLKRRLNRGKISFTIYGTVEAPKYRLL